MCKCNNYHTPPLHAPPPNCSLGPQGRIFFDGPIMACISFSLKAQFNSLWVKMRKNNVSFPYTVEFLAQFCTHRRSLASEVMEKGLI